MSSVLHQIIMAPHGCALRSSEGLHSSYTSVTKRQFKSWASDSKPVIWFELVWSIPEGRPQYEYVWSYIMITWHELLWISTAKAVLCSLFWLARFCGKKVSGWSIVLYWLSEFARHCKATRRNTQKFHKSIKRTYCSTSECDHQSWMLPMCRKHCVDHSNHSTDLDLSLQYPTSQQSGL